MNEEKIEEDKIKVIYGSQNLKEILSDLIEKAFINNIKKCENK